LQEIANNFLGREEAYVLLVTKEHTPSCHQENARNLLCIEKSYQVFVSYLETAFFSSFLPKKP